MGQTSRLSSLPLFPPFVSAVVTSQSSWDLTMYFNMLADYLRRSMESTKCILTAAGLLLRCSAKMLAVLIGSSPGEKKVSE
ncbi:unnamed protein product [Urochloa humidicola]